MDIRAVIVVVGVGTKRILNASAGNQSLVVQSVAICFIGWHSETQDLLRYARNWDSQTISLFGGNSDEFAE